MSAGGSLRVRTATDGLTVGLTALAVFALHGFDGPLGRDLGVFTYGGEHVAAGVPPYLGIFNSVGPLSDLLPGLAIWVGAHLGADPVSAERYLFVVLAAGCCVLLSYLARDLLVARAAAFLAPAVLLVFRDFSDLASDGPREKTAMVLLLLATLVLLGRRRWFAAGLTTALATLTWQPVFAVTTAAAVATLLLLRSGRVRAAIAYLAGGVVTTGAFAAWFLARGGLRAAVDGFVVVNAEYTRQPSLLGDPGYVWSFLWEGYHASLLLVPVGLLAVIAAGARAVPAAKRGDERAARWVALGAAALAGTAWTVAVVNGPPDLFVLLPFAALGLTGVVVRLAARAPRWRPQALVLAVALVAVTAAAAGAVTTSTDTLTKQRADVTAVLAAVPATATVLSINAPEVLALANRTNPTPYQVFDLAMDGYLDHTWPGGLHGYATWIGRTRPTLVAFAAGRHQSWPYHDLHRDYWYAGRGPGWGWYVSRSEGPATLAAVTRAIHAARHG